MLVDPEKQLAKLVRDLAHWLSQTNPTEAFRAKMLVTMLSLNHVAVRIKKTRNAKERRLLLDEFSKRASAIEKGIRLLRKTKRRHQSREGTPLRAVP